MPTWGTARTRTTAALALLLLALVAVPARAASGPASAVVTACKDDHMTVVGAVKLTGSAARKARGAKLQLRFQALPLFSLPKAGIWRDLGTKTKGSGQEIFTGLTAGSWSGLMSWRFKKGSRTVLSGDQRSEPGKAGSTRGAGFCTLAEGLKPVDNTPPTITVTPEDTVWHHGPTQVQVFAQDDFSGVRGVAYSVDGGPATAVRNGGSFTIDSEAAHNVGVSAIDVAGNVATHVLVVRVDESAPTKPQLTRPFSVTASTTPTFNWTASTDSGSGLKGYFLGIKRASDGAFVSFTPFDAATTSAVSPQALTDGETYIATVVAVDNTDFPFSSESDPLTFRVDTHAEVTGTDPADGAIMSGGRQAGNISLTLDRPADPATVSPTTVALHVNAESGSDPGFTVNCNSPCTTITVDPTPSSLPEGRYTVALSGVKSEEGVAFAPFTLHFAVAFRDDPAGGAGPTGTCTSSEITTLDSSPGASTLSTGADGESGVLSYDYAVTGSGYGGVRVRDGSTTIADSGHHAGGSSGHDTLQFSFGTAGSHPITVQYYAFCGVGGQPTTITATNVVGSRLP